MVEEPGLRRRHVAIITIIDPYGNADVMMSDPKARKGMPTSLCKGVLDEAFRPRYLWPFPRCTSIRALAQISLPHKVLQLAEMKPEQFLVILREN
jgi:hypothetical protein